MFQNMMVFEGKFDGMSRTEMIELLDKAKDAYYNSGDVNVRRGKYSDAKLRKISDICK